MNPSFARTSVNIHVTEAVTCSDVSTITLLLLVANTHTHTRTNTNDLFFFSLHSSCSTDAISSYSSIISARPNETRDITGSYLTICSLLTRWRTKQSVQTCLIFYFTTNCSRTTTCWKYERVFSWILLLCNFVSSVTVRRILNSVCWKCNYEPRRFPR